MAENRPSARQRGYDGKWDKARKSYLASHPCCVMCAQQGMQTAATRVDHIKAHKGDQKLFWSQANWQPLCQVHHDASKARDERGRARNVIGFDGWPA